jgi:tetratricopeptide (TPR) repeat protein
MTKLVFILLGILILAVIFIRRYQILEYGFSPFEFLKQAKKKNIFHFVSQKPDEGKFEITVEEMIPTKENIHHKNRSKADTLKRRADIFLEKGDFMSAEKYLIQALIFDPSNHELYHKLGLLFLSQERFGKAEMMYRKLIVSGFIEPSYYSNLALALYQQRKLAEAKSFYEKALEMDQTRPGRFFSLGQVSYELQEFEEALRHFLKALEMDPENLDYLITISQLHIDQNNPQQAHQFLTRILMIAPEHRLAQEMMAKAKL